MAIGQTGAVQGGRRKRNQIAELNARQGLLPQILANQQRTEDIQRQEGQFNRQLGLQEREFAFNQNAAKKSRQAADRASEVGMGLEAGKLGMTLASRYGDKSLGDVVGGAKGMFSSKPSQSYNFGGGSGGNFMSNLSVGSTIGGGLAGFGAAKMLGKKKSKALKGLAGAGVGAALGLLGGGNSLGGAISGGFGGTIGGLFG